MAGRAAADQAGDPPRAIGLVDRGRVLRPLASQTEDRLEEAGTFKSEQSGRGADRLGSRQHGGRTEWMGGRSTLLAEPSAAAEDGLGCSR
jgi:hypothetical protein